MAKAYADSHIALVIPSSLITNRQTIRSIAQNNLIFIRFNNTTTTYAPRIVDCKFDIQKTINSNPIKNIMGLVVT